MEYLTGIEGRMEFRGGTGVMKEQVPIALIKNISDKIVREFHPERIVLFGSYANGTPSGDSDVDMLVVLSHAGRDIDREVEIRMKVRPPFPMDILVRTPKKVAERIAIDDTFMRDIVESGKLLYEAHHN